MTPQFTTPCFVRIEDADKRKEILEKTADFLLPINMSADSNYLFAFEGWLSRLYGRGLKGEKGIKELEAANFLDCGTNTELFLALAGMRNDTDRNQWFKLKDDYSHLAKRFFLNIFLFPYDDFYIDARRFYRRATTTEIIEHFKKTNN